MSDDEIKRKPGRPPSTSRKIPVSWHLSPEAKAALPLIAAKLGVSQGAAVELAIRAFAKIQGVKWPKP